MPEKAIQVPRSTWKRIEAVLLKMEQPEWLNEDEVCALLKIKKQTLASRVSDGTIPRSYYTISITKKRFYDKSKILGL